MKKLLSICALILFAGTAGMSTANAQSPVKFGIRGGLNFANLNNVDGTDARTGFQAGAYLNFKVPMSPVSIQPEVLYTQKGYDTNSGSVNLDYVEIPVMAKFDFITPGPVTPNVSFGPYMGFNVNAEDKSGLFGGNIENSVKNTEFGVAVGGGVDVSKLHLGIRYNAGLTDTFENGDGKNSVFSIIAGISF